MHLCFPKQIAVYFRYTRHQSLFILAMKTIFLSFLLLTLGVHFFSSCNQYNKQGNEANQRGSVSGDTIQDLANNPAAMDLHERLMNSFSDDWMERESDPDLYPDFYGGSFIDNNGIFVIAITGDRKRYNEELAARLGTNNFNVEAVQYSYKQMMQVMDKIDAFLVDTTIPENHPVVTHFAGAYPDVMENRVKVILTVVSKEITDTFKKDISDSPIIVFEQGEIPELF